MLELRVMVDARLQALVIVTVVLPDSFRLIEIFTQIRAVT